ncbi:MAG: hypothetical protein WBB29_09220 [Geitlerinemataceae cyanobacterium]
MSEPNLQNVTILSNSEVKAAEERIASDSEKLLANLILELHNIPECYWLNLLQIIRLFRESVTQNQTAIDPEQKLLNQLASNEAVVWSPQADSAGIQALSDLLTAAQGKPHA